MMAGTSDYEAARTQSSQLPSCQVHRAVLYRYKEGPNGVCAPIHTGGPAGSVV
jgi:hypothetical protein